MLKLDEGMLADLASEQSHDDLIAAEMTAFNCSVGDTIVFVGDPSDLSLVHVLPF
jgi:hypothetical protein